MFFASSIMKRALSMDKDDDSEDQDSPPDKKFKSDVEKVQKPLRFKPGTSRDNDKAVIKFALPKTGDGVIDNKFFTLQYHTGQKTVQIELKIPMPMPKLMDKFYAYAYTSMKNGLDVMKLFDRKSKNTKEILESTAVIHHLGKYLSKNKIDIRNRKKLMVDVGGGNNPRTASLFFTFDENPESKFWSVDPEMGKKYVETPVHPKIECYDKLIEDVSIEAHSDKELIILVGVHCHANMDDLWKRCVLMDKPIIMVSMPCCKGFVNKPIDVEPVYYVSDPAIPSAKDELYIFTHGCDQFRKI